MERALRRPARCGRNRCRFTRRTAGQSIGEKCRLAGEEFRSVLHLGVEEGDQRENIKALDKHGTDGPLPCPCPWKGPTNGSSFLGRSFDPRKLLGERMDALAEILRARRERGVKSGRS